MAEQDWPACQNVGGVATGARGTTAGSVGALPQRAGGAPALERHQRPLHKRTLADRAGAATYVPRHGADAPRLSNWRNERMATCIGSREHSRKIVGSRQVRRAKLCQ